MAASDSIYMYHRSSFSSSHILQVFKRKLVRPVRINVIEILEVVVMGLLGDEGLAPMNS